jgi:hypothetical protein
MYASIIDVILGIAVLLLALSAARLVARVRQHQRRLEILEREHRQASPAPGIDSLRARHSPRQMH